MFSESLSHTCRIHGESLLEPPLCAGGALLPSGGPHLSGAVCTPDVHRVSWCVSFISENTRVKEDQQLVGSNAEGAGEHWVKGPTAGGRREMRDEDWQFHSTRLSFIFNC